MLKCQLLCNKNIRNIEQTLKLRYNGTKLSHVNTKKYCFKKF